MVDSLNDALNIIRTGESIVAFGIETSDGREELCTLLLGELGAERVDGDVERAAIGFESENLAHDLGSRRWESLTELVEVFQIGLVQTVTDDLDIEIVEVLSREAVTEVGSYMSA